jgi:hypothetical protein
MGLGIEDYLETSLRKIDLPWNTRAFKNPAQAKDVRFEEYLTLLIRPYK